MLNIRKFIGGAAMALCLLAPASSAWAQQGAAPLTCTQAYGKCFDYCAAQFPSGREASAKCVDACFMARADCDRNGCFRTDLASTCNLEKR